MTETISEETGEITELPPIIVRNAMTRVRVAKHFTGPSLAKQSFQKECDINTIMRKYEKTGTIEHLNQHQGEYGNYIGFVDYHASLNQILEADAAFLTIPARIRAKFENDPGKFLEFAQNPENIDAMRDMGLAPSKRPEAMPEAETPPEGETSAAEAAAAVAAATTPPTAEKTAPE